MKTIVFLFVVGGIWFAYRWLQKPAAQAVLKAPERYAQNLAESEKRAVDAGAKANAAIERTQKAVNQVVEDAK